MIIQKIQEIERILKGIEALKQVVIGNGDINQALTLLVNEPSALIIFNGEAGSANNAILERDLNVLIYVQTAYIGNDAENLEKRADILDEILDKIRAVQGFVSYNINYSFNAEAGKSLDIISLTVKQTY